MPIKDRRQKVRLQFGEGRSNGRRQKLAAFFGLKRNIVVLLASLVLIGMGEELWMRFLPKYLDAVGATVFAIGLFDALKTLLGALYAYPGGAAIDHWGHRRALIGFTLMSIAGYALVLLVPRWGAVIAAMFLFLAWTCFSLPATFAVVGTVLAAEKHAMGIAIQSSIKRLPIIAGPIAGGVLIDRFGIIRGVQIGLVVTIVLSLAALLVQRQIVEPAAHRAAPDLNFWAVAKSFSPSLRRLLLSDILIRFCERIPFAWIIIYAIDRVGVSATQAGALTSIETIAALLCIVPAAWLADKYGREPFVIATFVFFTLFPLTLYFAHSFALLALAFALRGFKEFGEPARKALIIGSASSGMHGRVTGVYYLIRDTVVTPGAFIGAALWKISPQTNFLAATGIGAAATAFYLATSRRRE